MIQAYIITTTVISTYCMLRLKTKMGALDNFFGSAVAGMALGWLIWPFCIWAVEKQKHL